MLSKAGLLRRYHRYVSSNGRLLLQRIKNMYWVGLKQKHTTLGVFLFWRPGSESNRHTRICSPLHNHSATRPERVIGY